MKRLLVLVGAAFLALYAWGTELVVYTYDSFVSWGPALAIKEAFERAHPGVKLVWIAPGDSSEMLARLIAELELGLPTADVFVGLADVEVPRALARNVFRPLDPGRLQNLRDVPPELRIGGDRFVVPYDHGYVTLVYDARALPEELVPRTLTDLLRPELKGKIVLQDPRTSSPGLSFFLWTIVRYGEGWPAFWEKLLRNVLTVTRGWSESFDMLEAGEAPIGVSYATDEAYAQITYGERRFRVLTPEGEGFRQVEYMGIVRTTTKVELAHALLDLILSPEIQELIPTSQWMFPANARARVPEEFARYAVIPARPVTLDPETIAQNLSGWLRTWQGLLGR
ncbi:MAG: thiamine ABC transporter substrate-binding protein [Candidatus Bipolaricaulota bacterium]|nr:thiamine ABC transporter substrate-binding protein [Candidatus Bipolaricaulota bacterium]